jgi:uncharacterized protein YjiS (DUF1127 family)
MNAYSPTLTTNLSPWLPLQFACRSAWRAACRGWLHARHLQRCAAVEREGLRQLHAMDDRMLSDIGLSRGDLPWMAQRDAFALLREDVGAYNRAHGLGGRLFTTSGGN